MFFKSSKFWISVLFLLNFTALFTDVSFGILWFLNAALGVIGLAFLASAIVDWLAGRDASGPQTPHHMQGMN